MGTEDSRQKKRGLDTTAQDRLCAEAFKLSTTKRRTFGLAEFISSVVLSGAVSIAIANSANPMPRQFHSGTTVLLIGMCGTVGSLIALMYYGQRRMNHYRLLVQIIGCGCGCILGLLLSVLCKEFVGHEDRRITEYERLVRMMFSSIDAAQFECKLSSGAFADDVHALQTHQNIVDLSRRTPYSFQIYLDSRCRDGYVVVATPKDAPPGCKVFVLTANGEVWAKEPPLLVQPDLLFSDKWRTPEWEYIESVRVESPPPAPNPP